MCQLHKRKATKGVKKTSNQNKGSSEVIHIDIYGPFSNTCTMLNSILSPLLTVSFMDMLTYQRIRLELYTTLSF